MLYHQTIEPGTLELLKSLMLKDYLNQFVLVGGPALALQMGHRKSDDLDLFTIQDFNSDLLISNILQDYTLQPTLKTTQTLVCTIQGIKVDFIRFKYPFIYPVQIIDGIRMLSIEDIAPMKLDAITGRGRKKDFYDLYFLLKQFNLEELLSLYKKKYPHETTFHVTRSLAYFADAENDPDPFVVNRKITWEKVKKAISSEIQKI